MPRPYRFRFLDSVKNLLSSGTYSDLVITCGDDVYNVHKAIVCPQSGFFRGAIRFGGRESIENRINLPEDDPAIVKVLIQFLYDGRYDTGPSAPDDELLHSDGSQSSTGSLDLPFDSMAQWPHKCYPTGSDGPPHTVCPHHRCTFDCNGTDVAIICDICFPSWDHPSKPFYTQRCTRSQTSTMSRP